MRQTACGPRPGHRASLARMGRRPSRRRGRNRPPRPGRGARNRQAALRLRLRAGAPGCSLGRAAGQRSRRLPTSRLARRRWFATADRAAHEDRRALRCSGARFPPPVPPGGEAGSRPIADPSGPRRRTRLGACRSRSANLLPKPFRSPWRVSRPSVSRQNGRGTGPRRRAKKRSKITVTSPSKFWVKRRPNVGRRP